MRISHKHHFIFLSNPRCGSTSIRKILDRYSDIESDDRGPYYHHISAPNLRKQFIEMGWVWEDYYSFTTIRNPWARMLSAYKFGQQNQTSVWHRIGEEAGSFQAFIHHPDTFSDKRGLKSIDRFAFDEDGIPLLNDIIPLEQLDKILPALLEQIGIKESNIPMINTTLPLFKRIRSVLLPDSTHAQNINPAAYRQYYGAEERDIVARVFAADIEMGKYQF